MDRRTRVGGFAILALGLVLGAFFLMERGNWLQSSLLGGNTTTMTVWNHDFSTGLPAGWKQQLCGGEPALVEPFICLQGTVEVRWAATMSSPSLVMAAATKRSAENIDIQVLSPDKVLTKKVTLQGKQEIELPVPTLTNGTNTFQVLLRVPADTEILFHTLQFTAQIQHKSQEIATGTTMTSTVMQETTVVTNTNTNASTNTNQNQQQSTNVNAVTGAIQVGDAYLPAYRASGGGSSSSGGSSPVAPPAGTTISTAKLEVIAADTVTQKSGPRSATVQTQTPQAKRNFTDVESKYFAATAIADLAGRQIVGGYPDGSFRPFTPVNRAEWAKLLTTALPNQPARVAAVTLQDVSSEWFAPYVQTLIRAGVVRGYPDGTFRAGSAVTRAEAIKMLVLSAGATEDQIQKDFTAWLGQGNDISSLFSDAANDQWFSPYLYEAHKKGVLSGRVEGGKRLSAPLASMSRGEAAELLYRVLQR